MVVVPLESVPSRDRDLNVGGGNRDIHDAINSNNDDQHHYDNHDNHETMSSTRLQIFEHPGILAGMTLPLCTQCTRLSALCSAYRKSLCSIAK